MKKKKKKKPVAKRVAPLDKISARIRELVPDVKEAQGDLLKSWDMFARKILLAKQQKTVKERWNEKPLSPHRLIGELWAAVKNKP